MISCFSYRLHWYFYNWKCSIDRNIMLVFYTPRFSLPDFKRVCIFIEIIWKFIYHSFFYVANFMKKTISLNNWHSFSMLSLLFSCWSRYEKFIVLKIYVWIFFYNCNLFSNHYFTTNRFLLKLSIHKIWVGKLMIRRNKISFSLPSQFLFINMSFSTYLHHTLSL